MENRSRGGSKGLAIRVAFCLTKTRPRRSCARRERDARRDAKGWSRRMAHSLCTAFRSVEIASGATGDLSDRGAGPVVGDHGRKLLGNMERGLHERDRVGVQDFVLLEDFRSEAAFIDNLRKRFNEDLIYVSRKRNYASNIDLCIVLEKRPTC